MADRWHSVEEVSEHLGVAPDTVYRWIAARQMPAHRIGRHWKFQLAEVDTWVRAGHAHQGAPGTNREAAASATAR